MLVTNRGGYRIDKDGWPNLSLKAVLLGKAQAVPTLTLNTMSELTEYSGTGYAGGFGGGGRQSVGSRTSTEDDTNGRVKDDGADVSFTGISGPAAIAPVVALIVENTNDAGSDVIAFVPIKISSASIAPTAASNANPGQLDFGSAHGLSTNDLVYLEGFAGGTWGTQLNGKLFAAVVVDSDSITLKDGAGTAVDTTGFGTATLASALVYRPLPMNGAAVNVAWHADGIVTTTNTVGAQVS